MRQARAAPAHTNIDCADTNIDCGTLGIKSSAAGKMAVRHGCSSQCLHFTKAWKHGADLQAWPDGGRGGLRGPGDHAVRITAPAASAQEPQLGITQ